MHKKKKYGRNKTLRLIKFNVPLCTFGLQNCRQISNNIRFIGM